jgi:hypothetical protein
MSSKKTPTSREVKYFTVIPPWQAENVKVKRLVALGCEAKQWPHLGPRRVGAHNSWICNHIFFIWTAKLPPKRPPQQLIVVQLERVFPFELMFLVREVPRLRHAIHDL